MFKKKPKQEHWIELKNYSSDVNITIIDKLLKFFDKNLCSI
jgi:hypothetical protein